MWILEETNKQTNLDDSWQLEQLYIFLQQMYKKLKFSRIILFQQNIEYKMEAPFFYVKAKLNIDVNSDANKTWTDQSLDISFYLLPQRQWSLLVQWYL